MVCNRVYFMKITLDKILEMVRGESDISIKNREYHNVQLRRIYYKLSVELTPHTLASIGLLVGRDHSTVYHNLQKFHLVEKSKYIEVYYRCLDELTGSRKLTEYLNIKGQENINSVILPKSLLEKLRMLDEDQLTDFEKFRLDPYIKMNVQ